MTREQLMKLEPGDVVEYELGLDVDRATGVFTRRFVYAVFLHASRNPRRAVIRPEFKPDTWNRARSVGMDKLRDWH